MNIAFQLALHDYSASIDVGFNAPVRSDGQTVSFRVDGAFYLAIYINVFAAREPPLTTTDLPMRVISPRKVSGGLSVSMSAAPWETARESLILPQCVRLHGGRGRVPGRAV
jgi:hypothetical protein